MGFSGASANANGPAGGYGSMGSVVGWTCPSLQAQASGIFPAAGAVLLMQFIVPVAKLSSNFNMWVTVAGNTLANTFACIVNQAGTLQAQTVDRSADAALTTPGSLWSPPWQNPVVLQAGMYWFGLMFGSAVTLPTFTSETIRGASLANLGCTAQASNLRVAAFGAGLSALPASIPIASASANQNCLWAATT
jgi:hypothetical protein